MSKEQVTSQDPTSPELTGEQLIQKAIDSISALTTVYDKIGGIRANVVNNIESHDIQWMSPRDNYHSHSEWLKRALDHLEGNFFKNNKEAASDLLNVAYHANNLESFKILLARGARSDPKDPNSYHNTSQQKLSTESRQFNNSSQFRSWEKIASDVERLYSLDQSMTDKFLSKVLLSKFITQEGLKKFFKDSFAYYLKHNELPDDYMDSFSACCERIDLSQQTLFQSILGISLFEEVEALVIVRTIETRGPTRVENLVNKAKLLIERDDTESRDFMQKKTNLMKDVILEKIMKDATPEEEAKLQLIAKLLMPTILDLPMGEDKVNLVGKTLPDAQQMAYRNETSILLQAGTKIADLVERVQTEALQLADTIRQKEATPHLSPAERVQLKDLIQIQVTMSPQLATLHISPAEIDQLNDLMQLIELLRPHPDDADLLEAGGIHLTGEAPADQG